MERIIRCADIRFVKDLYPRIRPIDDVVERYRDALDNLPPITVARDGILVDGYHRWQAHVREGREEIRAENLGNLSDAEIIRESITRNASHGQQLSRQDKQRMAAHLWAALAHLPNSERIEEITQTLAVSRDAVERWTKDARKSERDALQERAWSLWLDCMSIRAIAAEIRGPDEDTIGRWLSAKTANAEFAEPPASRQHFDIWQFATADKDMGQQSYFGALPPQVAENLLWFFTEPGQIVVDLFAGSGTVVDVAKAMGRRVWASDIRGNYYSPHLPIHFHDAAIGWPDGAPRKADLLFLDPPYWRQAAGRYSQQPGEMAEMDIGHFMQTWLSIVSYAVQHAERIAYIISPSVTEDASVVDHATAMLAAFVQIDWHVERRVIVPYQTQQSSGAQVEWARDNKRMLMLYRDLVVLRP
jgi:hypothetical protein